MRDFHRPGRSAVHAMHGMAATSMPGATLVAIDVLRDGGNALDACVAAAAALAVIEPQSTGIGGDCFCLYAPAGEKRVIALNGSGRAAAAATIDHYADRNAEMLDPTSADTVTIPGAVGSWEKLLATHGRKSLDELLRPAIALAEDGFPVHARVAHDWAAAADRLRQNEADTFLPDGRTPTEGEVFRNPALGQTLRAIARDGARVFYEGDIAADMVSTLRARGGVQTEADFAAGRTAAEFVAPISIPWRGYEVWQCPPNGSGLLVLMILGLLEGFDPPPDGPLGAVRLHRHIEAARLVYRDRNAFLGDPAQVEVPVARLTEAAYLAALRELIADDRAMVPMPAPGEAALPVHRDTVYLCAVDRDGNACSFINSLFESFGCGIVAAKSGVILHNRGYSFQLERRHPNCIAPFKRPMHTIIPGMLTRGGEAVMPFGVMGGHFQPVGQTLFLSNFLEHGLDIQQALDLPRVLPLRGMVQLERGIPDAVANQLRRFGHDITFVEKPLGGGQAIWIDRARGTLIGGSDPRKDGMALGY